jgi:hypothetical protein
MPPFRKNLLLVSLILIIVAACAPVPGTPAPPAQTAVVSTTAATPRLTLEPPAPTAPVLPPQAAVWGIALTHQQLDGNRLAAGSGGLPAKPLDIPLTGSPLWVVAAPLSDSSVWVVALADGRVQAFQIADRQVSEIVLNVAGLPPGMPPVLINAGNQVELLAPMPEASAFTNPIRLEDGTQAYIDVDGDLRLVRQGTSAALPVDALPDARILADGGGHLLLLSCPTGIYSHGVLGDMLEASTITLVDTTQDPMSSRVIQIDPGDVIEGIAPIWVDLDGDGQREIIVTQSNTGTGARLVVYREDGSLFASGAPLGQGFRWRHQLAAGQFIPGGALEIAVIRTPHIGGVLEIYGLVGDRLEIQAELSGFSSHQIGSRNLDSALGADFNGDGQVEIVIPDQSQTTLAGIQALDDALQMVWEAPIGGKLTTNLAAVTMPDGWLGLGVGHENNTLRLWLP